MVEIKMISGSIYYSKDPEGIVEMKINGAVGHVGSVPMYKVYETQDAPVPTHKINLLLVESIRKV